MSRIIPQAIRSAVAHKPSLGASPVPQRTRTHYHVIETWKGFFSGEITPHIEANYASLDEALMDGCKDSTYPENGIRKDVLGMLEITYSDDLLRILSIKQWTLAQIEAAIDERLEERKDYES